jgi:hypothetical protein
VTSVAIQLESDYEEPEGSKWDSEYVAYAKYEEEARGWNHRSYRSKDSNEVDDDTKDRSSPPEEVFPHHYAPHEPSDRANSEAEHRLDG